MAMILVFFGMTASGKSSLAQLLAERYKAPYYNTDRVRKELAGLPATAHRSDAVGQGIYSHDLSAKTYAALLHRAEEELSRKGSTLVLLDGSYASLAERERVRHLAGKLGAGLRFIYCWCGEEETRRRLQQRARDPFAVSDGRWEIYVHQLQSFTQPLESEKDIYLCDTEAAPEELLQQLIEAGILAAETPS